MEKEKEVSRNYTKPDVDMLLLGNYFLETFLKNKTIFTDKFTDLNDPFATNMRNKFIVCEAFTKDLSIRLNKNQKTANINIEMESGRTSFQYVLKYLKLAEPNNLELYKAYGMSEYDKARRSNIKLPLLLEQAFEIANGAVLKQKLIAKGATENDILNLHAISLLITSALKMQTTIKGARKLSKKDRINNLNSFWADMQLLSICAKTVFMNDYAMYNNFLLYPKTKKTDKGKEEGEKPAE